MAFLDAVRGEGRSNRRLPRVWVLISDVCGLGLVYWMVGGALLVQSWRGHLIETCLLALYPVFAAALLLASVLTLRIRSPRLRRARIVLEAISAFALLELGKGWIDLYIERGVPTPFPPMISPAKMISGYDILVNEVLGPTSQAGERGAVAHRHPKALETRSREHYDPKEWVVIADLNPRDAGKAHSALGAAGILAVAQGSLFYSVDVQQRDREQAIRILERDAQQRGYWIRLHRAPSPHAPAKKESRSLSLELKFPEPISTPEKAEFVVTLTNRSAQPILVLNYPSPDRGLYPECRDAQGRAISMRSGPVVSAPAIRLEDLVVLRPGHGRTNRLRWATHFRDSTPGGGRIRMSFIYTTGDFPPVVSKRGAKVWRGTVRSNWVALEVQPKTGLPSGSRLRVFDSAH